MNKKVLLLFSVTPKNKGDDNWQGFGAQISKELAGADIIVSSLSELGYLANGDKSRIWHRKEGWDIADFNLVIFVNSGTKQEFAITAARYLQDKDVQYIDRYLKRAVPSGKLACGMQRSLEGIKIVPTLGATSGTKLLNLIKDKDLFEEIFTNYPIILKADVGRKGMDNYLVKSLDELREILMPNKETGFVAQPFIPNDGDYRLLIMGKEVTLAFKRSGDKSITHLNNTSAGGKSVLIKIDTIPKDAIKMSVRAAKIEKLSVAGVDLIQNNETNEWFVLEVNMSPQLITGDFHNEKVKEYAQMIEQMLEKDSSRNKLSKNIPLEAAKLIGRREWAGVRESGQITRAKMDTGAYWSSMHVKSAEKIGENLKVEFDNGESRAFEKFRVIDVASTKGEAERRFAVKLNLLIGDEEFETDVTLTQRHGLRYKLLIGRRALRLGGFIVDPSRSFHFKNSKEKINNKLK